MSELYPDVAAKPRRLILVGPSGSGKSVVARRLVTRLPEWHLMDTDDVIREQFGVELISDIFERFGEATFREAENEIVANIASGPTQLVVATGGGLPAIPGAMESLCNSGFTVYLRASLELLWRRINGDADKMRDLPMLHDGGRSRLEELIEIREPIYQHAAVSLDTEALTVDAVVDALSALAD